MILKQDQWSSIQSEQPPPTPLHASDLSSSGLYSPDSDSSTVRGAINFRRVPKSSLYALSQPTKDGIKRVLQKVRNNLTTSAGGSEGEDKKVVWINLRFVAIRFFCLWRFDTDTKLRSQRRASDLHKVSAASQRIESRCSRTNVCGQRYSLRFTTRSRLSQERQVLCVSE